MKFGFQEIRIGIAPFDFSVVCIIGDRERLDEYCRWKFEDAGFKSVKNYGCEPRGEVMARDGYVPVMWIPRYPRKSREYATLAHEALHCVYVLFEWAKIPLSGDTEEVCAHAMGHIVTEVLERGKR